MKFFILFLLFLTINLFAHKSPEPIDINCQLENLIDTRGTKERYYQKLNPAISTQMVRDHYDLEGGMPNSFTGWINTKIFVKAEIKTKQGIISKSGYLTAQYDKRSQGLQIASLHGMTMSEITVHWQYPNKESYEDSFSNSVVSCSVFP